PGTCPHAAVLAHERKHEGADNEAVRKHAPRLQRAIQVAVAHLGPIEAPSDKHDSAQARLAARMQSAFDEAWREFQADRSDLQRQVDAGLEYARVAASCPDWSPTHR